MFMFRLKKLLNRCSFKHTWDCLMELFDNMNNYSELSVLWYSEVNLAQKMKKPDLNDNTLCYSKELQTNIYISGSVRCSFPCSKSTKPFCFYLFLKILNSLEIRQKGESQNRCFKKKKQSAPNFSKKQYFLPPDTHLYVCVSGVKKCSFFGKFGVLCFLETPILRFVLLPYYRRTS